MAISAFIDKPQQITLKQDRTNFKISLNTRLGNLLCAHSFLQLLLRNGSWVDLGVVLKDIEPHLSRSSCSSSKCYCLTTHS